MDEQLLQERAKELIDIKRQIKKLLIKEKEMKGELLPLIKEYGAVNFDYGRVYYVASKGAETFSRKVVLQYLKEAYGEALADQVDRDCTKHNESKEILYITVNDL
ncbi:hypothetical protein GCAAIG_06600 [Candidatus Electronema halotolerans]|jgi:hypothetical protein